MCQTLLISNGNFYPLGVVKGALTGGRRWVGRQDQRRGRSVDRMQNEI